MLSHRQHDESDSELETAPPKVQLQVIYRGRYGGCFSDVHIIMEFAHCHELVQAGRCYPGHPQAAKDATRPGVLVDCGLPLPMRNAICTSSCESNIHTNHVSTGTATRSIVRLRSLEY